MNGKLAEAQKALARAAYLVHRTYPEVKEPKLFVSIADALAAALVNGIGSVMDLERRNARVIVDQKDFDTEVTLFRKHCVPKYKIDENAIVVLRKCMTILKAQKEYPVSFSRQGRWVICSEDYDEKVVLDEKMVKEYLKIAESFMQNVEGAVNGA